MDVKLTKDAAQTLGDDKICLTQEKDYRFVGNLGFADMGTVM